MYDFIGDIHGHASELKLLLNKLGYVPKNGNYVHPENHKLIFIGDYIDRGPEIPEVLGIVKGMVDSSIAIALMGNHEYNAICWNLKNDRGEFCRDHSDKNTTQHEETLKQFEGKVGLYLEYIEWFKTLPLFIENNEFRAIHACWDDEEIEYFKSINGGNAFFSDHIIVESSQKGNRAYDNVEILVKGKEMMLPGGQSFLDKDNHKRFEIRVKWWKDPSKTNLKDYSVLSIDNLPETPVGLNMSYYPMADKPVYFGHYWLTGEPILQASNICCLDYSVAKGDKLVAYTWHGKELSDEHFVWVSAQ